VAAPQQRRLRAVFETYLFTKAPITLVEAGEKTSGAIATAGRRDEPGFTIGSLKGE
jgi:hypothetical protein